MLCYVGHNYKKSYTGDAASLEDFWPYHFSDCSETEASGTPGPREQRALDMAGFSDRVQVLGTLYGICAENDKGWMDYIRTAGSPQQLKELAAALILCPDHPQRSKVEGFVQAAQHKNELVRQGRIFYDGTHRVGTKVAPGSYYATPPHGGCYWERTDSAGNIIANNFSNGLRVEMTVAPSDYSIKVQGCGEWRPIGE